MFSFFLRKISLKVNKIKRPCHRKKTNSTIRCFVLFLSHYFNYQYQVDKKQWSHETSYFQKLILKERLCQWNKIQFCFLSKEDRWIYLFGTNFSVLQSKQQIGCCLSTKLITKNSAKNTKSHLLCMKINTMTFPSSASSTYYWVITEYVLPQTKTNS